MSVSYQNIDILKAWCLKGTLNFTRFFFKQRFKRKFVVGEHHELIAAALDKVFAGEIKKLIINIAPRYSKTELAVKNFIPYGFAINPKAKFIHLSYSDDLARDNSLEVQNIMREPEYQRLFGVSPQTSGSKKMVTSEGGGLYSVSSGGQVTGFGAGLVDEEWDDNTFDEFTTNDDKTLFGGAIIIDDPIKPDDALSESIREKVNQKFDTTIRNRVNSRNTPIIIIMQRLHENDLCGYLMKKEPGEWEVLSLPCITTDKETGERKALWEFKHTLQELDDLRAKNPFVFDTQYLQDPQPLEGLMYERGFKEYEIKPPTDYSITKAYVDTADTGKDYLCALIYDETEIGNFVKEIIYMQKPMEVTEPLLAQMLAKYKVKKCVVESNNGGRGFCRAVEKLSRKMNNNITEFEWFHQTQNKQTRIFTRSGEVQNIIFMPKGWKTLFPEYSKDMLRHMKVGTNPHDDAPDATTGTVEFRTSSTKQDLTGYFN